MTMIHLDREMTKQELQMENRRMRNFIRDLVDRTTELDLKYGKEHNAHMICDHILYLINSYVSTMPNEELISRYIERTKE